eukprot:UN25969
MEIIRNVLKRTETELITFRNLTRDDMVSFANILKPKLNKKEQKLFIHYSGHGYINVNEKKGPLCLHLVGIDGHGINTIKFFNKLNLPSFYIF